MAHRSTLGGKNNATLTDIIHRRTQEYTEAYNLPLLGKLHTNGAEFFTAQCATDRTPWPSSHNRLKRLIHQDSIGQFCLKLLSDVWECAAILPRVQRSAGAPPRDQWESFKNFKLHILRGGGEQWTLQGWFFDRRTQRWWQCYKAQEANHYQHR